MSLFDENPFSREVPASPDAEQASDLQRAVFWVVLVLILSFGLYALFQGI